MADRRDSDYSSVSGKGRNDLSRLRRILLPLLILVVAGLLYFRYASVHQADDGAWRAPPGMATPSIETAGPSWPVRQANPMPASTQPPERFNKESRNDPEAAEVIISIDRGFDPVVFKMAAVTHRLPLAEHSPRAISFLPDFTGYHQRFGNLVLNDRDYVLALDADIDGYRLFVDRNANGDLGDDGEPLKNEGKGLFSAGLRLPLSRVTGYDWMRGEYRLWLYAGHKERPPASLNYYARTQLRGKVQLPSGSYDIYLADNRKLDGDFTNDGVSIDLNRDGRIELIDEYIPPNRHALIDGIRYRFTVKGP